MPKISYDAFKAKLMDPSVPEAEIARYLKADPKASGPFDPRLMPDPKKVAMTAEGDFDVESAMRWGNAICRWRRQARFTDLIALGDKRPVLVSEGDSWFQFPFIIDEVVDQLGSDYLIWSLDAAGDTADNMVNRRPEYFEGLKAQKPNKVAAFLFSAAGNDVIGEDLDGKPVLARLLKPFSPGKDAIAHIDQAVLAQILTRLEADYRKVVATIRSDAAFRKLPILIHGYDYAIPGGQPGDPRKPIHARQDQWLGRPLKDKGIVDAKLQRAIIRVLIDALYDMLAKVAGASATTNVHLVNVRGTLTDVTDWADEIHATSAGFAEVAKHFRKALEKAL